MKIDTNNLSTMRTVVVILIMMATGPALASGPDQLSRSTGYLLQDGNHDDAMVFTRADTPGKTADKYLPDGTVTSKPRDGNQKAFYDSGFWIYDADAVLYFDFDNDGFFSGLDVSFDADTDYFSVDVYARLYLSRDGGPWLLYYTTDVFTINSTSADDEYLVETDLIDGYPSGYYDVFIELYDWEYDEHVASFGPLESSALSALPLEDETRDAGYIPPPVPPVSYSSGGGGSMGLFWLIVATLTLVLRHHRAEESRLKPLPQGAL